MLHRIAVIPDDGIGKEVVPVAIRVLEMAGRRFGITFNWNCDFYIKTGRMMPADGLDQIKKFEAIYLGAVGLPGVPDHVSIWGLLIDRRPPLQRHARRTGRPAIRLHAPRVRLCHALCL